MDLEEKKLNEKIEKAEIEIYQNRVSESAKMNLSFAEGFIQGQVSMRKFYKDLINKPKGIRGVDFDEYNIK